MTLDIILVILLIALSGTFSGLTIGLMGLSKTEVTRQSETGDDSTKWYAKQVLPLIEDSNLLLVTLLLGNTAVNATLAIFLGGVVGEGLYAGIASTVLILIFGEILPASILSKHALKVGGLSAPIVKKLILLLWPFTIIIARLLDKYVGKEGLQFLSREELVHIVKQHESSDNSDIDNLDKKAMVGTLLLTEKIVGDHMSKDVYTLKTTDKYTKELVQEMKDKGYTRIPIIEDDNVVGIINVKDLIGVGVDGRELSELISHRNVIRVKAEEKLDNVLNRMLKMKKQKHIAVVTSYDTFVGIITMEDIIEEILMTEIRDEFDND